MKSDTLLVLAIWLTPFAAIILLSGLRVRILRRRYIHDFILYRLCDARDRAAVLAATGQLSEDSVIFEYFYKFLSKLIHEHRRHPLGFSHICRMLAKTNSGPTSTFVRRLVREIKASDEPVKEMVGVYLAATRAILLNNWLVYLMEHRKNRTGAALFKRYTSSPVAGNERATAKFSLSLATAAQWQGGSVPCHA